MNVPFGRTALLAMLLAFANACSRDQGNGGQADDRSKLACVVTTDFYIVHFTAYQEPADADRNDRLKAFSPYCQDLPRTGKSYLTVDMLDADVKDTPISVRVVAIVEDKSAREIAVLPAKTYKTGIVEVVADLAEAGEYLLELKVGSGASDDESLRIPLRVALHPPLRERAALLVLGLGVFVGIVALIALGGHLWRKHHVQANA